MIVTSFSRPRILILGGTRFLGPHIIAALKDSYDITIFHRTGSPPSFQVKEILGDRSRSIKPLIGKNWDIIIDTCGYTPTDVERVIPLIKENDSLYVFISTVYVYPDFGMGGGSEQSPTLQPKWGSEVNAATYGSLKVACEKVIQDQGIRALIVRPGVLIGPGDHTGRLRFWLDIVKEDAVVPVPGRPERLIQLTDARDLAIWLLAAITESKTGIYNFTSNPIRFDRVLEIVCQAASSKATPQFLKYKDELHSSFPLINFDLDEKILSKKVEAGGFRFRSLEETLANFDPNMWPSKSFVSKKTRDELLRLGR